MNPDELVQTLRQSGVALVVEGENLRYRAPAGALTPELRSELAAHKAAILAYLRSQDAERRLAKTKTTVSNLHQSIRQAQDEGDLGIILDRAQAAYERGELVREEVERLAILARHQARSPAKREDTDRPGENG